jgi:hypothetical protein
MLAHSEHRAMENCRVLWSIDSTLRRTDHQTGPSLPVSHSGKGKGEIILALNQSNTKIWRSVGSGKIQYFMKHPTV